MNTQRVEGHTPTPEILPEDIDAAFEPLLKWAQAKHDCINHEGLAPMQSPYDSCGEEHCEKCELVKLLRPVWNRRDSYIESLEKVNEALVRALEPFAQMADDYDAEFGKTDTTSLATAIGGLDPRLLRDARAALAKEPA